MLTNTYSLDALLGPLWHNRLGRHEYNPRGVDVFEEDWDNLILLDACRYDEFATRHSLSGRCESRQSLGSCSAQFVRGNLDGRTLHDVVIVTANAWYEKVRAEQPGFEVHDLVVVEEADDPNDRKQRFVDAGRGGWVDPSRVTERARAVNEQYPNKRLLVHYHQPHTPYIGPTGVEYFGELPFKFAWNSDGVIDVSDDILRTAYRENLDIALTQVGALLPGLTGKTVVSADHGELLGDRRFPLYVPGFGCLRRRYGHPCGIYIDQLTKIPWFVVEAEERKTVTAEKPAHKGDLTETDLQQVDERLEQLGYKV